MWDDKENSTGLKKRFAQALIKQPDQPVVAALEVFGHNNSVAMRVAWEWPLDPEVKEFMAEIAEANGGEKAFLPSRNDYALSVWRLAKDETKPTSERLSAFRLFGDICGYIEKPNAPNVNVNVGNQNRVMIVRDFGTDEEWERAAEAQQQKLLSGNETTAH